MALDVVDDPKPVPQRVDELPVDEVAAAGIDTGCRLARVDKQPQPIAPCVLAEVVETGPFAGARDEIGEWRRHGGRYYTSVENKC